MKPTTREPAIARAASKFDDIDDEETAIFLPSPELLAAAQEAEKTEPAPAPAHDDEGHPETMRASCLDLPRAVPTFEHEQPETD